MTAEIRILIAEDHLLVRTGLKLLIECQSDMKVVGEADNGQAALDQVHQLQPDIAVVDLSMPIKNGLEFLTEVSQFRRPPKILVLTANKDSSYMQRVVALGGAGYVHKQSAAEDLILAIRTVARGHQFLPAGTIAWKSTEERAGLSNVTPEPSTLLSDREKSVLQLIARGITNKEIAASLDLSVKTVETYKARAMQKLNLNGRADIVRYALQHHWLNGSTDSN